VKLQKTRDLNIPTGVLGLALDPERSRLFAACMDGQILEIDSATGEISTFIGTHGSFASGCVFSSATGTLISGGYDGALLWHGAETKQTIRKVLAHSFWSWQLALSADGSQVVSVSGQYLPGGEKYEPAAATEPLVKVYDVKSGAMVREFEHVPPVLSAAFSPDGSFVAAANMMGEIRVWNVQSGERVASFTSPDFTSWGIIKSPHYCGGIYSLAFAPDAETLLCCGMGPMADPMAGNGKMTWQRWAWKETPPRMASQIRDGEHGSGLMETIAFAPDGQTFVMAGKQAQGTWTTALFSSADGKLLASLDTKSRVTRSVFSPDGKTIFLAAAVGQEKRRADGKWPDYGRIHVVTVTE
jgi:WD40 repeat protein